MKEFLSSAGKSKITLTRRDFVKVAVTATGFLGLGGIIGAEVWKSQRKPSTLIVTSDVVSKDKKISEAERKIGEIKQYRRRLGLDGLPEELEHIGTASWIGEAQPFENNLSQKNLSYGEYVKETLNNVFGKNATRLVRGCKEDPTKPGAIEFNQSDRFCVFSSNINATPIYPDFINYILHEACGHGSDPYSKTVGYPSEILIGVEHGKWRALAQMFSIPDQFLNNPGDVMYPRLKKNLGRVIGLSIAKGEGNLSDFFDDGGKALISKSIESLANSMGLAPENIKFNKLVCRQIGATIMAYLLRGELGLKGEMESKYSSELELGVAPEIYAEMVKYAILYPEKVNSEIVEGITEVLVAIGGSGVDLRTLRSEISYPNMDVVERNLAEKKMILSLSRGEPGPQFSQSQQTAVQEDMVTILVQEMQNVMREELFKNFIYLGKLPETLKIAPEKKELVRQFADLYSGYITKHPHIEEFDIINDDRFDADMHIWEIEDLAYALNPQFVRSLVQSDTLPDEKYEEISKKVKILKNLIGVQVFYQR